MPPRIMGASSNTRKAKLESLGKKNYNYDYPDLGIDLKPGTPEHDKLASFIYQRASDSHNAMKARFSNWQEIDKTLTAYIDLTESEEAIKDNDSRKPVSIVFPNSYAIMETMLSYMAMAFFQDPIFRYEGYGPDDTVGAILLEKVIQQHVMFNKVALNLHTMFRDNFAYGMGIVAPTWRVKRGKLPRLKDVTSRNWMGIEKTSGQEIVYEDAIIHEGNALMNIDPYKYLPDPNVAATAVQDGEFCGYITPDNLMNLLEDEDNDPAMFNVKYLRDLTSGESSLVLAEQSNRNLKTNGTDRPNNAADSYHNKVDVIVMYMKIIPADHGLSDKETPEIWVFELAADTVIIKAEPLGFAHGLFPVCVVASEDDGYATAPISRIEVLFGLQGVLDWLFNSHIANVRKSLNDMFIVDPYLVNINDIKDPNPGKLIRMRRPAWGRGVQNAVAQLPVADVTRQNIGETGMISSLMQTLAGTDNPIMGNLRQGGPERLTGAEFQGTMQGAASRLERVARLISLQGMQSISYMFASHTQQLLNKEGYVKTVGLWPEVIQKQYGLTNEPIPYTPYDLIIEYDVIPRDGSIPGGNFAQSWVQLFQIIGNSPELLQQFDSVRIFKHIATNLGAKNVEQFERSQVRAMPDAQVAQQAQAGNLAPIGG